MNCTKHQPNVSTDERPPGSSLAVECQVIKQSDIYPQDRKVNWKEQSEQPVVHSRITQEQDIMMWSYVLGNCIHNKVVH